MVNRINSTGSIRELYRLAHLYGIQTAYYGVQHRRQTAVLDGLLAALKVLGAPVLSLSDVSHALRERAQSQRKQILEPVTVVWNGEPPVINVTLPSEIAGLPCNYRLEHESGKCTEWKWQADELPVIQSAEVGGKCYLVKKITLPESLTFGYHRFFFEVKGKSAGTMIISAPARNYSPTNSENKRVWGTFLPLYALKTAHDWGIGDYSGLREMVDGTEMVGGKVVGTLPLLPVFLDKPYDPSPYAPVSRLLWNECYVDVTKSPEFSRCPAAHSLVYSPSFISEIESLRGQELVDYRRVMTLKRKVMEELCCCLLASGNERLEEFKCFAVENPIVEEYARFRAVMEKQRNPWGSWQPRLKEGVLRPADYDENIKYYHLYAQWLAHQQVRELAEKSRQKGVSLYFDLPLGVHPDGYDVWRHRDIFASDVSAGAPPDAVFTTGQNWGFPPLHPEKIREQGYRYVIDYLRHHLQHAAMLRIDHVMGMHRLFWIPRGLDANHGVYVRYRDEEFYAILALESQRHQSVIVGEDLGIVPDYVRSTMARHGLHRMYILYYELADSAARTPRAIHRNCIASLNTHDMPPFAGFWEGVDIDENVRLGLLTEKESIAEKDNRGDTKAALTSFVQSNGFLKKAGDGTRAAFRACLAFLSASRAHTVLVNLEDLWLETRPQNVPGTGDRFPSWRRKARFGLEDFCRMKEVSDILKEVDNARKGKKRQGR